MNQHSGSTRSDDDIVVADLGDPNRGRIDPSRMGRPHDPSDPEPYPIVTSPRKIAPKPSG